MARSRDSPWRTRDGRSSIANSLVATLSVAGPIGRDLSYLTGDAGQYPWKLKAIVDLAGRQLGRDDYVGAFVHVVAISGTVLGRVADKLAPPD